MLGRWASVRRKAIIAGLVLASATAAGYLSTWVSLPAVREDVRRQVAREIQEVQQIWPSAARAPTLWLNRSALRASGPGDDVLLPVGSPRKPWAYLVVKPSLPFVARIYYGCAAGGQLGSGRERTYLTLFGVTRCVQTRSLWFF